MDKNNEKSKKENSDSKNEKDAKRYIDDENENFLTDMPPLVNVRNDILKKSKVEYGWNQVNTNVYEGLLDSEIYPALYYTGTDPENGKNGAGYTESDETVAKKKLDREERPYG
ncbi:MAG: hypothetical protein RR052_01650 [Oscillospiraceae bacterium]